MRRVTTYSQKYFFEENDALTFRIEMLKNGISSYNALAKLIGIDSYTISCIVRGKKPCTKKFFDDLKKVGMNFKFNAKKEEVELYE